MTNSKNKSNKRAVTRFTALFICMILVCGFALPLFVYAGTVSNIYINTHGRNLYIGGTKYTTGWYDLNTNTKYSSNSYSGTTHYSSYYMYNNTHYELSRDTNNPTVIPASVYTHSSFSINGYGNFESNGNLTGYFILEETGFTLTFNSQGGSSISPLTGVSGIVHLGESGQYYPQYVPTNHGYDFIGWSLTENGTVVWDVDVQADTTLYARWRIQHGYREIRFSVPFYENQACTDDITGALVQYNEMITVYQKHESSGDLSHFYGEIILDDTDSDYSRRVKGEYVGSNVYKFKFVADRNYLISPYIYPTYLCNVLVENYTAQYGDILFNGQASNEYDGDFTATFDTHQGVSISVALYLPNAFVNQWCYYTVSDENFDYIVNSEIVNPDASDNQVFMNYILKCNPTNNCTIVIRPRSIYDGYDITERVPIAVIDESTGEVSWVIDTENAWQETMSSVDYSFINDEIPVVMNGILDGIFSLQGLSLLVTIFIVVGFSAWLIRNY